MGEGMKGNLQLNLHALKVITILDSNKSRLPH